MPNTRKYNFELKSVRLNRKSIKSVDLVLLATDHDSFDYKLLEKEALIIVDTRGRYKNSKKVIKA